MSRIVIVILIPSVQACRSYCHTLIHSRRRLGSMTIVVEGELTFDITMRNYNTYLLQLQFGL
jgi:hypothetical protein